MPIVHDYREAVNAAVNGNFNALFKWVEFGVGEPFSEVEHRNFAATIGRCLREAITNCKEKTKKRLPFPATWAKGFEKHKNSVAQCLGSAFQSDTSSNFLFDFVQLANILNINVADQINQIEEMFNNNNKMTLQRNQNYSFEMLRIKCICLRTNEDISVLDHFIDNCVERFVTEDVLLSWCTRNKGLPSYELNEVVANCSTDIHLHKWDGLLQANISGLNEILIKKDDQRQKKQLLNTIDSQINAAAACKRKI